MNTLKEKHIAELMNQAESLEKIKASDSFLDTLNSKLDQLNQTPKQANRFTLRTFAKYAAVIALTFLNVGAVYTQFAVTDIEPEETESITEIASEYFPDYTSYTE